MMLVAVSLCLWDRCYVNNDPAESADVSEQVTAQIRRAIDEREALPGERLPPARDLAAELGVSTDTVRDSLRRLRDEGVLVKRLGLRVASSSEASGSATTARRLLGARDLRRHRKE